MCVIAVDPNDSAIAKIRAALSQRVTNALVLPLAIGNHVDHLTARSAAEAGWPPTLPIAFYEDLPYSARPQAAEQIESRAESLGLDLKAAFVCGAVDAAEAAARKRTLANCYDSQIDANVAEQISQFCNRYQGRERLWMNRAWLDAGLGTAI